MTTWSTSRAANAINIPHHPLCQAHPTCTTRPWSLSRSSKRNCSSRWINYCRTYAIWRKLPEGNYANRFDQIVILVNCTSKWLVSHKIILKVAFVGHHLDQVIGRLEASAGKYLVREQFNSAPQKTKIKNKIFLKLLLKDLNSCQSRCSTSRPLCWCSNTTWCRFSSRLAGTLCSRGTKEIRWKNKLIDKE